MNNVPIEELNALDAWVAEHVMNWHVFTSGRGSVCALANKDTPSECLYIIEPRHPFDGASDFSPSRIGEHAFEVLKKCCEFVKESYGHSVLLTDTMNGYCVGVNIPSFKFVTANTWELAITIFAKKVFDEKTPPR